MTQTEAIRVLQHMVRWGIISDEKMKEALRIAINSLKVDEMYHLEKEQADEFISKKVIEDIIAEIMQYMFLNGFGSEYQDDMRKIIEKHISGKEKK